MSNGVASSGTSLRSATKTNSASGSMNRRISQAEDARSMWMPCLVAHTHDRSPPPSVARRAPAARPVPRRHRTSPSTAATAASRSAGGKKSRRRMRRSSARSGRTSARPRRTDRCPARSLGIRRTASYSAARAAAHRLRQVTFLFRGSLGAPARHRRSDPPRAPPRPPTPAARASARPPAGRRDRRTAAPHPGDGACRHTAVRGVDGSRGSR